MTARVVAVVAAHDEADRIGDTVRALSAIEAVDEVIVLDDGSSDGTGVAARTAGASVLAIPRRIGKGGVLEHGLRLIGAAGVWLLADGDLGASASGLAVIVRPVLEGSTDLCVAVLPPQRGGGFGIVKRAAGWGIRALCGLDLRAPLSGQRAVRAECLAACRPLAGGFGVEVGMTVDAARHGFRLSEVEVPGLVHRPAGRSPAGFLHRGRQGLDIARALVSRAFGLR